jgi:segregation and condensation protein A
LQRFTQRTDRRDIFEDKWSVSEKIQELMQAISERPTMRFADLFAGATNRIEVIATFLALLELIRLKQLAALQREPFGEIEICRAPPPAITPAPPGELELAFEPPPEAAASPPPAEPPSA